LAKDLQLAFPGITEFSFRELKYMRQFYEFCSTNSIGHPVVAQLSWSNNKIILDKCKDANEAEFYINKSINNGWSKFDLKNNIESKLYEKSLLAQNNFAKTLEVSEELKRRVAYDFRDDYGIELLNGENPYGEKDIENSIMANLNDFLQSIEDKFLFAGRQVKLVLNEKEFFVDLLFYHLELNCYVIFELKASEFKPEHLGQIQGYQTLINRLKKKESMNNTIGILVCKDKDRMLVEYLLDDNIYPLGVATYNNKQYQDLSEDLKKLLPSEEQILKRLTNINDDKINP
jgi:predicted nuclease of restriction endonuclease-like (RecB) superfamily